MIRSVGGTDVDRQIEATCIASGIDTPPSGIDTPPTVRILERRCSTITAPQISEGAQVEALTKFG